MKAWWDALWRSVASLWRPGTTGGDDAADVSLPEQKIVAPSAETVRQGRSVDVFITRTARERDRLEEQLDRQLGLMTGGRYRGGDDEEGGR